jgi:hypothetical protein
MLWVAVPLDIDTRLTTELRTSRQYILLGTYIFQGNVNELRCSSFIFSHAFNDLF